MERSQSVGAIGLAFAALLMGSCANPFAPALRGNATSVWTEAQTVGELLENFVTAYELKDSLRYAELLDESFQFMYYDFALSRDDGWFRETDLQTTARLFRAYSNISLVWGGVGDATLALSTPDSLIEFRASYQLYLDDTSPLIGFARFAVEKQSEDRFRILLWQEEFSH